MEYGLEWQLSGRGGHDLVNPGNVAVKPRVMRCGMRPPYALVLEFIDLLKSYGSAEMTAMVDAGSQFAKPSIVVRWRFFEYFDPGSSRFLWVSDRCRLVMPKGSSYQILIEFNGRIPNSAGKAETVRKPPLTAVAVLT